MRLMSSQLWILGLQYERLEAIKPKEALSHRSEDYWQSWERPLSLAERACAMSHITAWEIIAERGSPTLVLEDDALLSRQLKKILSVTSNLGYIDHLTLETRGRKKLLARECSERIETRAGVHRFFRLYQDRSGAAAYIVSPEGAKKLLAESFFSAGLTDAIICRCRGLRSFQVDPAVAVQTDKASLYGIKPPVQFKSTIVNSAREYQGRTYSQFRRRIYAQVLMGLRRLRYAAAERREVRLHSGDFIHLGLDMS